jgi:hypothetical protein
MSIADMTIVLLVLGFLPLQIRRQQTHSRDIRWFVRATFWQLTLCYTASGCTSWQLEIPLIQRITSAIWAALGKLVQGP